MLRGGELGIFELYVNDGRRGVSFVDSFKAVGKLGSFRVLGSARFNITAHLSARRRWKNICALSSLVKSLASGEDASAKSARELLRLIGDLETK